MNFSDALELMKADKRLTRTCWKDKHVYVVIFRKRHPRLSGYPIEGKLYKNTPCAPICHGLSYGLASWNPTQDSVLADDWEVVPRHDFDWSFLDKLDDKNEKNV